MNPRAILFDLDGTLVDTIDLFERAALKALEEIGIVVDHATFLQWYQDGLHLRDWLRLHGKSEDHIPGVRARRDELYEDLLRTEVDWLPGAQELLEKLSTSKSSLSSPSSTSSPPLGIVTGSWRKYIDAISKRLDVARYFPVIITCDDMGMGKFMKPHPHGLLLAADKLGVDPKDCLYIGDQLFDMEAAERAGMEAILVKGTWTPPNAPQKPIDLFELGKRLL